MQWVQNGIEALKEIVVKVGPGTLWQKTDQKIFYIAFLLEPIDILNFLVVIVVIDELNNICGARFLPVTHESIDLGKAVFPIHSSNRNALCQRITSHLKWHYARNPAGVGWFRLTRTTRNNEAQRIVLVCAHSFGFQQN